MVAQMGAAPGHKLAIGAAQLGWLPKRSARLFMVKILVDQEVHIKINIFSTC